MDRGSWWSTPNDTMDVGNKHASGAEIRYEGGQSQSAVCSDFTDDNDGRSKPRVISSDFVCKGTQ